MRRFIVLVLLAQAACWSEKSFRDACVDAGNCVVDDAGVGTPALTWEEVSTELFGLDGGLTVGLDGGFTITFVNTGVGGGNRWVGGVLTRSGSVICIPASAATALEVFADGGLRTFPVPPHEPNAWEGGVLLPDGTVLGLPYSSNAFLVIPPDGGASWLLDAGLPRAGLSAPFFEGGVVTRSGKVLLASSAGPDLAVFDPGSGIITSHVVGASAGKMFSGAVLLADGESALVVPRDNLETVILTPSGPVGARLPTGGAHFAGGLLLPGGDALLMPTQGPGSFQRVGSAQLTPLGAPSNRYYFSAAWSTNGSAYAFETDGPATRIAVISQLGVVSEVPAPADLFGASHYGFVAMADGTVVGCPYDSSSVLFLRPNDRRTVSLRTMTSPWLNKW